MYHINLLVIVSLLLLPIRAAAGQHILYPHVPTSAEQKILHDILSNANELEDAFDPDQDHNVLKPGIRIAVARLDGEKEFILFQSPKEFCGNVGCAVEIWRQSDSKSLGYFSTYEQSIIIYDGKKNGLKNIGFPKEKFDYYFNGKKYTSDHCPMMGEESPMLEYKPLGKSP